MKIRLRPSTFLTLWSPWGSSDSGGNILFVNCVKYLGIIFDKRITWRLHTEMTEAKALRTFIRIHHLLKSERLSANIKLTLHKALNTSVKTYACPTWEFAAGTYILKFQCLQTRFSIPLENFQGACPSAICTRLSVFHIYIYIRLWKS
jgi:hypothetical protein